MITDKNNALIEYLDILGIWFWWVGDCLTFRSYKNSKIRDIENYMVKNEIEFQKITSSILMFDFNQYQVLNKITPLD